MSTSVFSNHCPSCNGAIDPTTGACCKCGEVVVTETDSEPVVFGDKPSIGILTTGSLETAVAAKLDALRPQVQAEARRTLAAEAELLQRSCGILQVDLAEVQNNATAENGEAAVQWAEAERLGLTLAHCQQQLQKVSAALYRLMDGVWGVCTGCGRKIGLLRLIADPAAELCLDCAQKKERTARKPAKKRRR